MSALTPEAVLADYLALADDSCVAVLPHVLRITAELGIAELLAADTMTVEDIAIATDADTEALYRLLRALVSVGVLLEDPARSFRLTETGHRLRADAPDSVRESVLNADSQRAWLHGIETIRSGRSVFDSVHGGDFFGHKNSDGDADRAFLRRMRERTGRLYGQFSTTPDWRQSDVVMDIGGGDGFMLERILREADHVKGILFDRPSVIDMVGNAEHIRSLGERCRLEKGDFFEALPSGADTHMLCSVLHDWTDSQVITILRNSRKALGDGGRLLIVEMLVPENHEWHPSRWSDIGMMVLTGGRERTAKEFTTLLGESGFTLSGVTPIPNSYFSVLEAK
ncbi:methyltransferase [Streptomyces sparsogenes]|uniref:methyltransferase n=1 Tax=Streptomyces sparsogenes TaxID=67365 RepID=UPI000824C47E|nr:methyltransferase [Streptomyces sparsogenes]